MLPHENVWRRHLCGALFVFSHQSESTYKQKRIDATVAQKGAELDKNALPRMKQEMNLTSVKIDDWTEGWVYYGEIFDPEN